MVRFLSLVKRLHFSQSNTKLLLSCLDVSGKSLLHKHRKQHWITHAGFFIRQTEHKPQRYWTQWRSWLPKVTTSTYRRRRCCCCCCCCGSSLNAASAISWLPQQLWLQTSCSQSPHYQHIHTDGTNTVHALAHVSALLLALVEMCVHARARTFPHNHQQSYHCFLDAYLPNAFHCEPHRLFSLNVQTCLLNNRSR